MLKAVAPLKSGTVDYLGGGCCVTLLAVAPLKSESVDYLGVDVVLL